ncbi:hypothetical protein SAMN05216559_0757 [Halomicrobium zhouii]|uniref:DUF6798 domain-containing protein n=1 Tax=Halomicrobium zhouii TaxID=767519 RepID=A0A1I6KG88_9EURY|nr:DUF6798 domain-containing protein [Halomicrobium zhouii]SFR90164.1 hypothetical protein SAMN05216559_0757 [Halomicrobium zhouii]
MSTGYFPDYITDTSRDTLLLTGVLLATFLLGFAIRGPLYQFGLNDHNEQLIVVYRFIDSSYLATDFVLNQKTRPASPRYLFGFLVGTISSGLGVKLAYFVLHLLSTVGILSSVFYLGREIFDDWIVGTAMVGTLLLPVTGDVSLGGNSLVGRYLLPSHLADAMALLGIICAYKRKYFWGFAILGLTSIIHASIGSWITGIVIVAITAREYDCLDGFEGLRRKVRALIVQLPWQPLLLYVLIAFAGLYRVIASNLDTTVSADTVWILAYFRHPHHYVPSSWPLVEIVEYVSVVALALALYTVARRNERRLFGDRESEVFALTFFVTAISVMGVGGFLFTEVVRLDFVVKLQPFHIDYYPKVLAFGLLVAGIRLSIDRVVSSTVSTNAALAVLFLLSASLVGTHVASHGVNGQMVVDGPTYSEESGSYEWIRENTPEESTIITPPSIRTARLGTDRAIVADYKTFVFTPEGIAGWKDRLDALCGTELQSFGECEYDQLSSEEIVGISQKYGACYLMVSSERLYEKFDLRYEDEEYRVYYVSGSEACD